MSDTYESENACKRRAMRLAMPEKTSLQTTVLSRHPKAMWF